MNINFTVKIAFLICGHSMAAMASNAMILSSLDVLYHPTCLSIILILGPFYNTIEPHKKFIKLRRTLEDAGRYKTPRGARVT